MKAKLKKPNAKTADNSIYHYTTMKKHVNIIQGSLSSLVAEGVERINITFVAISVCCVPRVASMQSIKLEII
jgi:hypothetical protein